MKKKAKKKLKDYVVIFVVLLIAIAWVSLIKEGYRLPVAKRLSQVIPTWIVVLDLVILLVSVALLTYPKKLSEMGQLLNLLVFTFSFILFSIGAERLPSVVVPIVGVIMLIGLIVRKSIEDEGGKKKRKTNKS